jgi:hypothetical protein
VANQFFSRSRRTPWDIEVNLRIECLRRNLHVLRRTHKCTPSTTTINTRSIIRADGGGVETAILKLRPSERGNYLSVVDHLRGKVSLRSLVRFKPITNSP